MRIRLHDDNDWLFIGFGFFIIFIAIAVATSVKAQPKPVWTGHYCEDAACVTATLNSLYPDRTGDAKVTFEAGCETCTHFWVWYRQ